MTTIAWDGKTLATDSRLTCGNSIRSENTQKIFKIGHYYGAFCGGHEEIFLAVEWLRANTFDAKKPELSDQFAGLLWDGRTITRVEKLLVCYEMPVKYTAAGTGVEFALGALACGASAADAVKAAAKHDIFTNSVIQKSPPFQRRLRK